jgi:hypothetical protein
MKYQSLNTLSYSFITIYLGPSHYKAFSMAHSWNLEPFCWAGLEPQSSQVVRIITMSHWHQLRVTSFQ